MQSLAYPHVWKIDIPFGIVLSDLGKSGFQDSSCSEHHDRTGHHWDQRHKSGYPDDGWTRVVLETLVDKMVYYWGANQCFDDTHSSVADYYLAMGKVMT